MEGTDDNSNEQAESTDAPHNDSLTTDDSLTNGQVRGETNTPRLTTDPQDASPLSLNTDSANASSSIAHPPQAANEASNSPHSLRGSGLLARRQATHTTSPEVQTMHTSIDIPARGDEDDVNGQLEHQRTRTQTPEPEQGVTSGEGPLTPRNDAGPFVFDGSAGRTDARQLEVPGIPEITGMLK